MACGRCSSKAAKVTYVHTASNGTVTVYKSEVEAKAAVARRGGSYKTQ
jgi:hypothetical protein